MNKKNNYLKRCKDSKRHYKTLIQVVNMIKMIDKKLEKTIQNLDGRKHTIIKIRTNNRIKIVDQDHSMRLVEGKQEYIIKESIYNRVNLIQ